MNSLKTLILFAALVVLLGCNKTRAPRKPSGVPASAVWAGGTDGGVFIDCAPSRNGEPNPCTVYNDGNGDVYMSGKFVVEGQKKGVPTDKLKFDSADGTRIYLEHDVALNPLPQDRPASVPKAALAGENGVYADCHPSDNNLSKCSLYLAATGENMFTGSYRCDSLPDAPCTGPIKYADRDEIVLQNAGDLKLVK